MKAKIHPKYIESKITCSCGETFTTHSTQPEIKVEICSKCHPFYTGKQKFIDSGGRVEKFQKKYAKRIQELKEVEEKAKREKAKREKAENEEKEQAEQAAASEEIVEENVEEQETKATEEQAKEEPKQEESKEEQPEEQSQDEA